MWDIPGIGDERGPAETHKKRALTHRAPSLPPTIDPVSQDLLRHNSILLGQGNRRIHRLPPL